MHKITLQTVFSILFWALISFTTVVMLIELAPKQGGWPYWDKVQHATIFAVLTTLGTLALANLAFRRNIAKICIGLATYGALIECLQSTLTMTRIASIGDWLADIVGIGIGLFLWILLIKNGPKTIKLYHDTRI